MAIPVIKIYLTEQLNTTDHSDLDMIYRDDISIAHG